MQVVKENLIFNLVNNRKSCKRDQYILTGAGSKAGSLPGSFFRMTESLL